MILTTPHQQIDHVLGIFKEHQSVLNVEDLKSKVNESLIVIEPSVINGIVEKLVRDQYIFKVSWTVAYQITFEGNLFIGYDKKRILDDESVTNALANENRIKSYETRLLYATWSAGIAAALLLLWQVYSFYNPQPIPVLNVKVEKTK